MKAELDQIKSVVVPLLGMKILLPYAVIAEIIAIQPVQPVNDRPSWVMGAMRWRNQEVLLLAYENALSSAPLPTAHAQSKILVIKSLYKEVHLAGFTLLAQSMPRLVTITSENLETSNKYEEDLGPLVVARAVFNDQSVIIPNLEELSQLLKSSQNYPDTTKDLPTS